jgi:hypothetical protein
MFAVYHGENAAGAALRAGVSTGIGAFLYFGIESALHVRRGGTDDAWNHAAAGAVTGGVLGGIAGGMRGSLWKGGAFAAVGVGAHALVKAMSRREEELEALNARYDGAPPSASERFLDALPAWFPLRRVTPEELQERRAKAALVERELAARLIREGASVGDATRDAREMMARRSMDDSLVRTDHQDSQKTDAPPRTA